MSVVVIVMVMVVKVVGGIMLEDENLRKWKEMVSVLMVMVMVMALVMVVVMVMVENVWECREEEMTLLPEAVGAGMWKPEYEFPGMHCSQAHTARHALPGTARHAQLGMHCQVLQGMHCTTTPKSG